MKTSTLFPRLSLLLGLAIATQTMGVHAGQFFQDFSGSAPGAITFSDRSQLFSTDLGSEARVVDDTYRELQLTSGAKSDTRAAYLLPELDPATPIYAFSAKWNSQIYGSFPNAGDGFSFNFGQLGTTNLLTSTTQEAGYGGGLAFCVQTFPGNNPGFYLKVDGTTVAVITNNPTTTWGNGNGTRHFFEVDWNYTNGLSVKMDGQGIFTNVATSNFTSRVGDRFVWGARSGTAREEVRLDNIVVVTGGNLVPVTTIAPSFADANSTQAATNAFDGDNNTDWVTSTNGGYVGTAVSSAARVLAYAVTSGSGQRSTDPQSWTLQGSDDGGTTWTNVSSGGGHFLSPVETRAHLATNYVSYNAYRLNIATNHDDVLTGLAELRLYEVKRVSPVSIPWNFSTADAWVNNPYLSSSADGSSLWSASRYALFVSKDYGVTWGGNFGSYFGNYDWRCSAQSADGNRVFFAADGGPIAGIKFYPNGSHEYLTTDAPNASWFGITMSADGTKVAAVAYGGGIYTSTNSGIHWTLTSAPTNTWMSIASSADGRVLAAGSYSDRMYVSLDYGATWTRRNAAPLTPLSISCSSDGSKMVVAGFGIWASSNYGTNWTVRYPGFSEWISIASSADGAKLVAGGVDGDVLTSTNSGVTWRPGLSLPGLEWQSVVSSADGTRLAAGAVSVSLSRTSSIYNWHHPILTQQNSGTNTTVSWTTNQTGFGLQRNFDLNTPDWVTLTNTATVANDKYHVTIPQSSSKGFFRLSPP